MVRFRFAQVFGEEPGGADTQDADLLSALDFDETGDYLATGDRGGRVVIFEHLACRKASGRSAVRHERADDERQRGAAASARDRDVYSSDEEADAELGANGRPRRRRRDDDDGSASTEGVDNGGALYNFLTEFQSHEPEFDYLRSLEIEEKISCVRWCKGAMGCKLLLTTNDKTIKMWKVYGKRIKTVARMGHCTANEAAGSLTSADGRSNGASPFGPGGAFSSATPQRSVAEELPSRCASLNCGVSVGGVGADGTRGGGGVGTPMLRLPRLSVCEQIITAVPKRVYANAHAYHINSLALSADGELFLSCDDLRLNLWHLNIASSCFNIVDTKPPSMETLSEVLTSCDFHPHQGHTFLYSTSRGSVRLGDMRANALCDRQSRIFTSTSATAALGSFFSDLTCSISSAKFSPDGHTIVARDFLNVYVWDVRRESQPLHRFGVHDELRSRLTDYYDQDAIFDQFDVCSNYNGSLVLSGSYGHSCRLFDATGQQPSTCLWASHSPHDDPHRSGAGAMHFEESVSPAARAGVRPGLAQLQRSSAADDDLAAWPSSGGGGGLRRAATLTAETFNDPLDDSPELSRRLLHATFHPRKNVIALAATASLYILAEARGGTPML